MTFDKAVAWKGALVVGAFGLMSFARTVTVQGPGGPRSFMPNMPDDVFGYVVMIVTILVVAGIGYGITGLVAALFNRSRSSEGK